MKKWNFMLSFTGFPFWQINYPLPNLYFIAHKTWTFTKGF